MGEMMAFADLHLIHGGIALRHTESNSEQLFYFTHVQWVSAVTLTESGAARITLHMEAERRWRILTLQMPETEMGLLAKVLRRRIPSNRCNIGRSVTLPIGPVPARIAGETLQGDMKLGARVTLYLLPHILVVLDGDLVQAKLDTSSIRRVLAVQKVTNPIDNIINLGMPDGVVRLYSFYENVAFALPQYRELAEEISYLSHCPVEFVYRDDKTRKI
jgi:hypothetical protein